MSLRAVASPPALCATTTATGFTGAYLPNNPPAVYALEPIDAFTCGGAPLDAVGLGLTEGPACAVVRASDAVGNVSISAPVRVCVDKDGDEPGCAPPTLEECADSCTVPAQFAARYVYPFDLVYEPPEECVSAPGRGSVGGPGQVGAPGSLDGGRSVSWANHRYVTVLPPLAFFPSDGRQRRIRSRRATTTGPA